ncbi:MAG TPA: MoxR family ATPase [Armatimonadota bacterium]|nr:MoxR family ATPase [Armatimonadota bacterium]
MTDISVVQGTVVQLCDAVKTEVAKAVKGQDAIVEGLLICLLADGHALLEGVPGTAKTLMAKALAHSLQCTFRRVQFTPDLMPSDIIGTTVYDMKSAEFFVKKGPIFSAVLLADEINRTPPKTQAALLQAMEERQVSIDGTDYTLPAPFLVIATQNPIEYEGTYPLPEAQLDRFLMKLKVDYPSSDEELAMLRLHQQGFDPHHLTESAIRPVAQADMLANAKAELCTITVEDSVLKYLVDLVAATRAANQSLLGGSPRATVALLRCSRVVAAMEGRSFVTPDDIKLVALPVLRHRIILRPEAELEGMTTDQLIDGVLAAVPVPR